MPLKSLLFILQSFIGQVNESQGNCKSEKLLLLDETYLHFNPAGKEFGEVWSVSYFFLKTHIPLSLTTAALGKTLSAYSFLAPKVLLFKKPFGSPSSSYIDLMWAKEVWTWACYQWDLMFYIKNWWLPCEMLHFPLSHSRILPSSWTMTNGNAIRWKSFSN